jgi:hypothetical protein
VTTRGYCGRIYEPYLEIWRKKQTTYFCIEGTTEAGSSIGQSCDMMAILSEVKLDLKSVFEGKVVQTVFSPDVCLHAVRSNFLESVRLCVVCVRMCV